MRNGACEACFIYSNRQITSQYTGQEKTRKNRSMYMKREIVTYLNRKYGKYFLKG